MGSDKTVLTPRVGEGDLLPLDTCVNPGTVWPKPWGRGNTVSFHSSGPRPPAHLANNETLSRYCPRSLPSPRWSFRPALAQKEAVGTSTTVQNIAETLSESRPRQDQVTTTSSTATNGGRSCCGQSRYDAWCASVFFLERQARGLLRRSTSTTSEPSKGTPTYGCDRRAPRTHVRVDYMGGTTAIV